MYSLFIHFTPKKRGEEEMDKLSEVMQARSNLAGNFKDAFPKPHASNLSSRSYWLLGPGKTHSI